MSTLTMGASLDGCRVLVTRERPGELATKLLARGAVVVHLPLIAVVEPDDAGVALQIELDRLDRYDWLVVTSPAGAERTGAHLSAAPRLRLAAVGTATAAALSAVSGRTADLIPAVQRADALAEEFIAAVDAPQRVLLAVGDRAASTFADAVRAAGHEVTALVAYRTVDLEPDTEVLDTALDGAHAVLFASGSAVESWSRVLGARRPPIVVAIGPATAATAGRLGLDVSSVAVEHSLDGLVDELVRQFDRAGLTAP